MIELPKNLRETPHDLFGKWIKATEVTWIGPGGADSNIDMAFLTEGLSRYFADLDALLKRYADDIMEASEKKFDSLEKAP